MKCRSSDKPCPRRTWRKRARWVSSTVLLAALDLLASAPAAQPTPREVPEAMRAVTFRQHIERASDCFKRNDYSCALISYAQAYEVNPQPVLLFNMAQICRKAGRTQEATTYYERFLREAPQSELATEARSNLSALRASEKPAAAATRRQPPPPLRTADTFWGTEAERQALFKQHIQTASAKVAAAEWDAAVGEYWAAYELKPQALIVFNVAQTYRKAGRLTEALALYQRYLQEEPGSPLSAEIEGYSAEINQHLLEQQHEADRQAAQRLAKANALLSKRLTEMERQKASQGPPARPRAIYRRPWFWGLLGTATAGLALGIGLGIGLQPRLPEVDLGARTLRF